MLPRIPRSSNNHTQNRETRPCQYVERGSDSGAKGDTTIFGLERRSECLESSGWGKKEHASVEAVKPAAAIEPICQIEIRFADLGSNPATSRARDTKAEGRVIRQKTNQM